MNTVSTVEIKPQKENKELDSFYSGLNSESRSETDPGTDETDSTLSEN